MGCRIRVLLLALVSSLLLTLTACQSGEVDSPEVAAQPTETPLAVPSHTPSLSPTLTQTPTATVPPSPTLTPSETIVPSPTNTLAPTHTLTPTPTITLTLTPSPTPTASLTPVQIIVRSEVGAYVRSGPDTHYPVVGEVDADAVFDALAYTINSKGDAWYLIKLPDGIPAWISQWVANRVNNVPLGLIAPAATVPASPTPLPTNTPTSTFTPSPTATLPPGANARVYDKTRVNLRSGPGLGFDKRGMMEPSAPLQLTGRNHDADWYEVNTFDGRSGWVLSDLVILYNVDATLLPVKWVDVTVPDGIVLTGERLFRTYEIYARGQQLGRRANSFVVVGDSTSANSHEWWFALFHGFRYGITSLGSHTYLQETVDFFGASGSLGADFQTAQSGFATDYLLDPVWANPALCNAGESPLDCEIRRTQPASAIIYIGIVDMVNYNNPPLYRQNLETIVTTLINQGVIPILTTFSIDEGHEVNAPYLGTYHQLNTIIRDVAARYQIPLIEFQQAALALPHNGCVEDGRHLYYNLDGSLNLDDSNRLGQALRELMTLQMLDALRVNVFGG